MLRSSYDPQLQCLTIIGEGKLQIQDFMDLIEKFEVDPRPKNLLVKTDYRNADVSALSKDNIEVLKRCILGLVENYETVREAIVVTAPLTFGLSRMYQSVLHSEKYDIRVFTDMDEARDWLGMV